MKTFIYILLLILITGCGNKITPLSPELSQKLNNQDGKIDEVKNNQNGMMLEIGKLRQTSEVHARDIGAYQQALIAKNDSHNNAGVQILQGDGALVLVFAVIVVALLLVYHFKTKAVKYQKTAELLAQQISGDQNMANRVFMAALDSDIEEHVYSLVAKNQKKMAILRTMKI